MYTPNPEIEKLRRKRCRKHSGIILSVRFFERIVTSSPNCLTRKLGIIII